jgi:hypothetical protein
LSSVCESMIKKVRMRGLNGKFLSQLVYGLNVLVPSQNFAGTPSIPNYKTFWFF